jgi:5-methylcytosine-specific restriction protein A
MDKPCTEDFVSEIYNILRNAKKDGKEYIEINAGELHRTVGGYPCKNHNMPS